MPWPEVVLDIMISTEFHELNWYHMKQLMNKSLYKANRKAQAFLQRGKLREKTFKLSRESPSKNLVKLKCETLLIDIL